MGSEEPTVENKTGYLTGNLEAPEDGTEGLVIAVGLDDEFNEKKECPNCGA